MKNTNKIVLVLKALAWLVLVGCPQPEQPEIWTEVKSPDGLDGTWVSSYNMWLMVDRNTNTLVSSNIDVIWELDEKTIKETSKKDYTSYVEKKSEITGKSESEIWEYQKKQYPGLDFVSYTEEKPYLEIFVMENDSVPAIVTVACSLCGFAAFESTDRFRSHHIGRTDNNCFQCIDRIICAVDLCLRFD
jgi:hypothetical protein